MTIELLFDVPKSLFAKNTICPAVLMLRAGVVAPTQSLVAPPKVSSKHRDLERACSIIIGWTEMLISFGGLVQYIT